MLGSKKVFVLRQGLYVAQVGLKLWTSGISVFTSPVLGYRLVQPHLAYGVLGSQSTTSYRLQALTMSLASQKCVCVYACGMCMCVTELQSQPQRIGRGRGERLMSVYIFEYVWRSEVSMSFSLSLLFSYWDRVQLNSELLFGSSCPQEFCLHLSSTRITDWLLYLLGFYMDARYLNSWSSQLRGKHFIHWPSPCPPKTFAKQLFYFLVSI